MSDLTPQIRASDVERERAAETLTAAAACGRLNVDELEERLAAVYEVSTRGELELLVADVSVDDAGPPAAPAAVRGTGLTVRPGAGGTRWLISVMGSNDRSGRWRIARRCVVLNVMGGGDLDLCNAELSDAVTHIDVLSVMGGGEIRIPDGVDVLVSKIALMGGNDVRIGDQLPPPGAPQIHLRLVSIMGGYAVRRGPKRTRAQRRLERQRRDELSE